MTPRQVIYQLKYLSDVARYSQAPQKRVFHHVKVAARLNEQFIKQLRMPALLLVDAGGEAHPEHPQIKTQRIDAYLFVSVAGDKFGEKAMLGAHRNFDDGKSTGKGLKELEVQLQSILGRLASESGVRLVIRRTGGSGSVEIDDVDSLIYERFSLEGRLISEPEYFPPTGFTAVPAGGGAVTLAWTAPPDRFDRHGTLAGTPVAHGATIRRKLGADPTGPTDGLAVGAAGQTSPVVDVPGAGTWHYAVFSEYDDDRDGVVNNYADTAPVAVVTV